MTQGAGLKRGSWPHGRLLLWPHSTLARGAVAAIPQSWVRTVQVLVGPIHVPWGSIRALRWPYRGPVVPCGEEALLERGRRVDSIRWRATHAPQLQGAWPGAKASDVGWSCTCLLLWGGQPVPTVLAQSHGRLGRMERERERHGVGLSESCHTMKSRADLQVLGCLTPGVLDPWAAAFLTCTAKCWCCWIGSPG